MAGNDIPMNQFPILESAEYVYVETGNIQGKMHKRNILSNIVQGDINETKDCNEIKSNCIIRGYKWVNSPLSTIAILETFVYSTDWIIQRFSVPGSKIRIFVRSFYDGSTWSEWESVTIT